MHTHEQHFGLLCHAASSEAARLARSVAVLLPHVQQTGPDPTVANGSWIESEVVVRSESEMGTVTDYRRTWLHPCRGRRVWESVGDNGSVDRGCGDDRWRCGVAHQGGIDTRPRGGRRHRGGSARHGIRCCVLSFDPGRGERCARDGRFLGWPRKFVACAQCNATLDAACAALEALNGIDVVGRGENWVRARSPLMWRRGSGGADITIDVSERDDACVVRLHSASATAWLLDGGESWSTLSRAESVVRARLESMGVRLLSYS